MTTKLAARHDADADAVHIPSDFEVFFSGKEKTDIRTLAEERECNAPGKFPPPCDVNLFFGFFFDGTNNNLKRDRPKHAQSNVARLYEAFPGGKDDHGSEPWKDLALYPNFFRTYIPGVGTEFDKVNDTGKGFNPFFSDRAAGLAFARHGEGRILWALVQALNHVSRYYANAPLVTDERFKKEFLSLSLTTPSAQAAYVGRERQPNAAMKFDQAFEKALKELRDNCSQVLPQPGNQRPKSMDKGWVKGIFFSCFGFSRGAAEARAFANWFVRVCRLDAKMAGEQGLTLAGISVTFDFLGLFDTVASVGLANSFLGIPDGHQAWANAEDALRVPSPVVRCMHLVSAHEVRRSFPLDSILVNGTAASSIDEIVYPGVHSDIGGGYEPREQGRGTDPTGCDKISRIPLGDMYREARVAGVPLKLEKAPEKVKEHFRVAPAAIDAFNAYIGACQGPNEGLLHELMAQQHLLYIRWRKMRLNSMQELPSVRASDEHDRTDLLNANGELHGEVERFERWLATRNDDGVEKPQSNWVERPGINNDGVEKPQPDRTEWPGITVAWRDQSPLHPAVANLFENYVHDSRAWFKPLGKDIVDLEHEMDQLVERMRLEERYGPRPDRPGEPSTALSEADIQRARNYLEHKERGNTRPALTPCPDGREPYSLGGGYLRFRKIYFGSDSWKPEGALFAQAEGSVQVA